MHTPARTLRGECDDLPGQRPAPCHREEERRTRILDAAQRLMANHGRSAIRLSDFALAMRIAPLTIRRHFVDMDCVLAQILHRHLMAIASALGTVPQNTPNRAAARRAAYLAATRTPFCNPTEAHLLLIRDRHLLPPDLREPLEAHHASIGEILAGPHSTATLALLEMPELAAPQIEAALAAIAHPAKPPASRPQPSSLPATPPSPQKPPTCQTLPPPGAHQWARTRPHDRHGRAGFGQNGPGKDWCLPLLANRNADEGIEAISRKRRLGQAERPPPARCG